MTKKLISVLLALTVLSAAVTPCLAQTGAQTQQEQDKQKKKEEEKRKKEEEKRREEEAKKGKEKEGKKDGGGLFGKVKNTAKKAGKVTLDVATGKTKVDPVALALKAVFNDQLPIKLDAGNVYAEVPPPASFRPVFLQPTTANLDNPLPPGDYTVPVRAICTKDSVHIPGRGVGYKLAPLQGRQADALATLIVRGNIAQVSHHALQAISWSIQASIPYGQMPREHQAVIDELIPEYKSEISGGFFQRVEDRYNKFVGENSKILPLDTLLEQAGVGENIRSLRRSRQIIREESLNYERMQQRLFDGDPREQVLTPDEPQTSPWTQLQPGVYVQFVVRDGWQGINDLNIRVTPEASADPAATGRLPDSPFADFSYRRASFAPRGIPLVLRLIFGLTEATAPRAAVGAAAGAGARAGAGPAAGAIAGAGVRAGARPAAVGAAMRYGVRRGLIAYSVTHATQALIILPNTKHGDGGGEKPKKGNWLDEAKRKSSDKVPDGWGNGEPSDGGWKWKNPRGPQEDIIRIQRGNPNSPNPSQQGDYVKIIRGGKVIGSDGQVLGSGRIPEAHIPLERWLQWSSWFRP